MYAVTYTVQYEVFRQAQPKNRKHWLILRRKATIFKITSLLCVIKLKFGWILLHLRNLYSTDLQ